MKEKKLKRYSKHPQKIQGITNMEDFSNRFSKRTHKKTESKTDLKKKRVNLTSSLKKATTEINEAHKISAPCIEN